MKSSVHQEVFSVVSDAMPIPRWSGLLPLTFLGVILVAVTLGALAAHVPGSEAFVPGGDQIRALALLTMAVLVYFAAVFVACRRATTCAFWLVVLIALAARGSLLFAPPILSGDVFRYVWDGRVQAAGINPYRYMPADPALAELRDEAVFPRINRAATATTIYAPAAEIVFAAIGMTVPGVTAVKVVMVGFEAMAMAAAVVVLRRLGLPPARIVIWAWNPLTIWEFAGNGHIDAMPAGLLGIALMLLPRGDRTLSGIAFGLAVLTKFVPLAAAPALWPMGRWRTAASAIVTIAALYACYAGAGWRVLGYLPGYGAEEGLTDGSGFWLLLTLSRLVTLPAAAGKIYLVLAALCLAGLAIWVAFVRRPMSDVAVWQSVGLLLGVTTILMSPHYQWYFAWLALPATVVPSRALIWLSVTPLLLYANPFRDPIVWPVLIYAPAMSLALVDWRAPLMLPSPAKEMSRE
jgi:alpha-1,6-mannosyltransferase